MNTKIFRRFATLIIGAWAVFAPLTSHAEPCETEDFQTAVTGKEQCLLLRSFGDTTPKETPNKSANSRQLSVNKDEEAETR